MFDNAEQKQENQIKAIRSFIAYQVDVIAFSPIVEDGWTNVLTEAREAGIPVLCTDRFISGADADLIVGFGGSDFYEEGRRAGTSCWKRRTGWARATSASWRLPARRTRRRCGSGPLASGT
jgi:ABC-type sugar transport system substrate-binding protein